MQLHAGPCDAETVQLGDHERWCYKWRESKEIFSSPAVVACELVVVGIANPNWLAFRGSILVPGFVFVELVPIKLGLKNLNAITKLLFVAKEPREIIGPSVDISATRGSNAFS